METPCEQLPCEPGNVWKGGGWSQAKVVALLYTRVRVSKLKEWTQMWSYKEEDDHTACAQLEEVRADGPGLLVFGLKGEA